MGPPEEPNNFFGGTFEYYLQSSKPAGFGSVYKFINTGRRYNFNSLHVAWTISLTFCAELPRPLLPAAMYQEYLRGSESEDVIFIMHYM